MFKGWKGFNRYSAHGNGFEKVVVLKGLSWFNAYAFLISIILSIKFTGESKDIVCSLYIRFCKPHVTGLVVLWGLKLIWKIKDIFSQFYKASVGLWIAHYRSIQVYFIHLQSQGLGSHNFSSTLGAKLAKESWLGLFLLNDTLPGTYYNSMIASVKFCHN